MGTFWVGSATTSPPWRRTMRKHFLCNSHSFPSGPGSRTAEASSSRRGMPPSRSSPSGPSRMKDHLA
eukprot:1424814-Pyramimonas_sp.AAC.1